LSECLIFSKFTKYFERATPQLQCQRLQFSEEKKVVSTVRSLGITLKAHIKRKKYLAFNNFKI